MAEQEREVMHYCDSPERIQKCLNCTKPECDNCLRHGDEGESASRFRKTAVFLKDIRTDLVKAIERGDHNKQICSQFNIGSSTLSRWLRQLKKEGAL